MPQVIVVESKVQAETVLELVQERVRQGKLTELWDFHADYERLCSEVEKTPPLPGLKKEFSMLLEFPGRKEEPFALVSAYSIATHAKGMFARPLYTAICLRAYHRRIRVIMLLRSLATSKPVLARYEDSHLKKQHDKFVYNKEALAQLATPDPDEAAAIRNACIKGGALNASTHGSLSLADYHPTFRFWCHLSRYHSADLTLSVSRMHAGRGGEAYFTFEELAPCLEAYCSNEHVLIFVEEGAWDDEDGLSPLCMGRHVQHALKMLARLLQEFAPSVQVATCSSLAALPHTLRTHDATRLFVIGEGWNGTDDMIDEAIHEARLSHPVHMHSALRPSADLSLLSSGGPVDEVFIPLAKKIEKLAQNREGKGLFDGEKQAAKGARHAHPRPQRPPRLPTPLHGTRAAATHPPARLPRPRSHPMCRSW